MILTLVLFFGSAGAIYFACEFFVNGIEWVGKRLNLGSTTTGTILAAMGTALPETAVTMVSVVLGKTPEQKDVGVGSALGGPLVLATIAYAIVGLVLLTSRKKLGRKTSKTEADHKRLATDQGWFLVVFAAKVVLGLVAFAGKRWFGLAFVAAYGLYVRTQLIQSGGADDDEEVEPLKLRPRDPNPTLAWALLQTLLALGVIAGASHLFVSQLGALGEAANLPPHVIALLLSPVATELPETMNAVIWVRQGKEKMALANISGAMMIQATLPSALGILFTPWIFDQTLMVAAGVTAVSIVWLWWMFRRGPVSGKLLVPLFLAYGGFAAFLVWHLM